MCTTTLMITRSPRCQCPASTHSLSLNHTAWCERSGANGKCAVAWWAVSCMLVVMHMTAHKRCLADVGYARQSADEGAFIIFWLMLPDWSSKDEKLLRGTIENMGGNVMCCKCSWQIVVPHRCYNSLILWSALTQWNWLHCTKEL